MTRFPWGRTKTSVRVSPIFGAITGWAICLSMPGCQVLQPDPIPAGPNFSKPYHVDQELRDLNDQPIEIGEPNVILDSVGWAVGIPSKLSLWNRRVDSHKVGEKTLSAVADYAADSGLDHVKVRVNQYAPHRDWKRLRANRTIHWLPRYTLGILSLGYETIAPGRIVGGDHFNPFTQTVHLYSDIPAIAYHELAHAKDFSRRAHQGTYAFAYTLIPIWSETIATQEALSYLADTGDRNEIADAVDILYPAYGTYAGGVASRFVSDSGAIPIHYGTLIASHLNARAVSRQIRKGEDIGAITAVTRAKTTHPISPTIREPSLDRTGEQADPTGMIDQDLAVLGSHRTNTENLVQSASFTINHDYQIDGLDDSFHGTTFRDAQPMGS